MAKLEQKVVHEIKQIFWSQFGASIDMLINVIAKCPDESYQRNKRFYYIAYHSVILLDYYITFPPEDFVPHLPFTVKDDEDRPKEALGDIIPDKIYTKQEMIEYLSSIRQKCKMLIESLTESDAISKRFVEGTGVGDMNYSVLEILLYNLRHTQHHTAQLNLLLRQELNMHMGWAFKTDEIKN